MGSELASHGYIVVSIDHSDAIRTAFPDGTYLGTGEHNQISDRVRDLGFVLDELTQWNLSDPMFAGRLDLAKVAAVGGSKGGATVGEFGRLDSRFKVLIGLDPGGFSLTPELVLARLLQPVLEINASDKADTTFYDIAANDAIWFQISNTDHLLVAGVDWYWAWHPENVAGGREGARTINAYTLWFLNKYLKGSTNPMPALADYPRVTGFKQK